MQTNTKRLRRDEAAKYLQEKWGLPTSKSCLAKAAVGGRGPAMEYFGTVPLYSTKALDDWARSSLSAPVTSTAGRRELRAA